MLSNLAPACNVLEFTMRVIFFAIPALPKSAWMSLAPCKLSIVQTQHLSSSLVATGFDHHHQLFQWNELQGAKCQHG